MKIPLETRLWLRVIEKGDDECWPWEGAKDQWGYGVIVDDDGKKAQTHRAGWQLVYGDIPKGQFVCHTCDVNNCMNPSHWYLQTRQEIQTRLSREGKLSGGPKVPPRGSQNKHSKLTEEIVYKLKRDLSLRTKSHAKLAQEYGVSRSLVGLIDGGKRWAHVQYP